MPWSARVAAVGLATAAACARPAVDSDPRPAAPPPSIVLITIDTLRADHVGFMGCQRDTTPYLDRLAAQSVVFRRAWSTSSWTVPAVVSILTGLAPVEHGIVTGVRQGGTVVWQPVVPDQLPWLPERLHALGYRTYGVVANGHLAADFGFGRGFDRFTCVGFEPFERVHDAIEAWRTELADASTPFFLWLHYFDPHMPYHRREPWFGRFAPGACEDDLARIRAAEKVWPEVSPEIMNNLDRYVPLGEALYDSEIRALDAAIERLFVDHSTLNAALLVVTSDHGEEFLDHDGIGHGRTLYEEVVHVPLLVRDPRRPHGVAIDRPVSVSDIAPTLAAFAGGPTPPEWAGIGLPGLGADDAGFRTVRAHLGRLPHQRLESVVSERWKLIVDRRTGDRELYDLEADPAEARDLAVAESAVTAELMRLLGPEPELAAVRQRTVDPATTERLRSLGYLD